MIYVISEEKTKWTSKRNPTHFSSYLQKNIHCQIDNSLDLGWKAEDIFLATNFDYEYREVRTFQIKGSSDIFLSKLKILEKLFRDKIITDNVWLHDFDCWQNMAFDFPKIKDIGVIYYVAAGLKNKEGAINGGSVFYRPSALGMIQAMVRYKIEKNSSTDEGPITNICKCTEHKERTTILNNTYNVGQTWLPKRYVLADKPIRVAHFHPRKRWLQFCEKKNGIQTQIVSDRLKALLGKYFMNNKLTRKVARYRKSTGMKNVLVYILSQKGGKYSETKAHTSLSPILQNYFFAQIDNSLDLGWKPEDIFLATNFKFEYRGVKSYIPPQEYMSDSLVFCNKLQVLKGLFQDKVITDNIWLHDIDCWQNTPFGLPDIKDIGAARYVKDGFINMGKTLNGGSVFYRSTALDMIDAMLELVRAKNIIKDESALNRICLETKKFDGRTTILNNTYNIGKTWLRERYTLADKPILAIHFHPERRWTQFCEKENKMRTRIVSDRLYNLLKPYFVDEFERRFPERITKWLLKLQNENTNN